MPSPDEVLEDDIGFRLERDDSDNDVYDDGDESEAESQLRSLSKL